MSERIFSKRNAPVWVQERRQPTREELAAKHAADGGGMGTSGSGNSLGDDDSAAGEITLSTGEVVKVLGAPKAAPGPGITVRRYNV